MPLAFGDLWQLRRDARDVVQARHATDTLPRFGAAPGGRQRETADAASGQGVHQESNTQQQDDCEKAGQDWWLA
jgi:hypothetical protein